MFRIARPALLCAAAALSCLMPSAARADGAIQLARECAAHVDQLQARTESAIIDETQSCLRRIRDLLAAGEVERAHAVARECAGTIEELADAGVAAIEEVCTRCTAVLIEEYGAERLAQKLRRYCHAAIDSIRHLERRALNAIASEFEA